MSRLPVLEGILKYIEEMNAPFSMPGHKGGRGFLSTREGSLLYESIVRGDITEVEGLDNLHSPNGIIKEAQELLQKLYGSRKSYFLVNGSTSGNLAMIFASFNEGDKVIVERNCHRSIFNAIIMRKLKPVYVNNVISKNYDAPISIDMEHFLQLIKNEENIKGIVVTYPNYYGICMDLKLIIHEARKRNIKVMVDSAHGAHFGIDETLPESAVKLGADMVVMSAHKTLPSLTQTAYLHINNMSDIDKLDFYVSAFTSTSPSYPFLLALDYARFYLETKGKESFNNTIKIAREYKDKINKLGKFHVMSRQDIRDEKNVYDIDESRYIINIRCAGNGHLLLRYLRENAIQCEMSDESNVVLILSPFNNIEDYEKLYHALEAFTPIDQGYMGKSASEFKMPELVLQPYEAAERTKRSIELEQSLGKICGENIVPYPPGIPLIMAGELIDKYIIDVVKYYLDNRLTVLGMEEGKIKIIEEQVL